MRTVIVVPCVPVLALVLGAAGCHRGRAGADLVLFNARIWTADPAHPSAAALVVRQGRFVYVGDEAVARSWKDVRGPSIDARGARVIPGLIDAHVHLISGGLQLSRLNLRDVPDRDAFVAAVGRRAAGTPKGQWIVGGRWSTESWADTSQPTREWIDAVTPEHPVLLWRMDGHGALANSVALMIAGIGRNGPPDPPGGMIERDPRTGEPTGILKDSAIDLAEKHIPPPTDAEMDEALRAAMRECHRHGITCVHTMSPWNELAAIDRARDRGALTLRVRFYISEEDWVPYISKAKSHHDDECVRICGFKQYADGSLGSRTAYMAAPYADNPRDRKDWRGLQRPFIWHTKGPKTGPDRESQLHRLCGSARPFSIAVHCIGDQANSDVLDIYANVFGNRFGPLEKSTPWIPERGAVRAGTDRRMPDSMRIRIEHAQHLLPADIFRFARLGVVASMQPCHKADDGRYAEKALGPERCKTSYAFRSLLDAGARVAFGSDWPVVSINPFLGIHAAVTGRTLDGKVFVPEQNISIDEALRCYTSGAAYAAADEGSLGVIKSGHFADFVVLEDDLLETDPANVDAVRVRATYVGGRRVYPPE